MTAGHDSRVEPAELIALIRRLRVPDYPDNGEVRLGPYILGYTAPKILASTLELIFVQRIYDARPIEFGDRIIDGGGWLGLSVLRFRELYPSAHITVFEPDPTIFKLLCNNLVRNEIENVEPIQAALADADGERTFYATGTDAGTLEGGGGNSITVPTHRLSRYLTSPVGLLKLNIEGAEAEVIDEIGDRLGVVDQVLIEYHGFGHLPQTLHGILHHLHDNGLTYIVSHFNEHNQACVPPLRLDNNYRYFLLIYARRISTIYKKV